MADHLNVSNSQPLILILIGLMMGLCILNCMANYIKQRISSDKLLVLWTNYALLEQEESTVYLTHAHKTSDNVTEQNSAKPPPSCILA